MGDTMATQEAYVQVKDLKKHYGDGDARLTVLDGIATSINRGEICVMLGPSGSGKSTFLNLIGGLEDADAGSILVDGCDLTVLKPTDLGEYRRRELGFVFQFYNLVPDLTVKEDIEVAARRIAWGKTLNAGQTCIAPDYLQNHRSQQDEFSRAFARALHRLHGDDAQQSPHYGRLVIDRAFGRVTSYLAQGKILVGGRTDPSDRYI